MKTIPLPHNHLFVRPSSLSIGNRDRRAIKIKTILACGLIAIFVAAPSALLAAAGKEEQRSTVDTSSMEQSSNHQIPGRTAYPQSQESIAETSRQSAFAFSLGAFKPGTGNTGASLMLGYDFHSGSALSWLGEDFSIQASLGALYFTRENWYAKNKNKNIEDDTFVVYDLNATGLYHIPTKSGMKPYVGVGLGLYYVTQYWTRGLYDGKGKYDETMYSTSLALGGNLLAGIEFPVSKAVSITADLQYIYISQKSDDGDTPGGMCLSAGMKFRF
jgi:Outer membrane protein beta-barrel domain